MTRNALKVLMDFTSPPRDTMPTETERDFRSSRSGACSGLPHTCRVGLVPLRFK